jgi:hypothetical protein
MKRNKWILLEVRKDGATTLYVYAREEDLQKPRRWWWPFGGKKKKALTNSTESDNNPL